MNCPDCLDWWGNSYPDYGQHFLVASQIKKGYFRRKFVLLFACLAFPCYRVDYQLLLLLLLLVSLLTADQYFWAFCQLGASGSPGPIGLLVLEQGYWWTLSCGLSGSWSSPPLRERQLLWNYSDYWSIQLLGPMAGSQRAKNGLAILLF